MRNAIGLDTLRKGTGIYSSERISQLFPGSERSASNLIYVVISLVTAGLIWSVTAKRDERVMSRGQVVANYEPHTGTNKLPRFLTTKIAGSVANVPFQEGAPFLKGDILLQLDTANLQIMKEQALRSSSLLNAQIENDTLISQQRNELEHRLQQLELMISDSTVRAPYDGIVLSCDVTQTNWIERGTNFMEIAPQNRTLLFETLVRSRDVAKIKQGQQALCFPDSFEYLTDRHLSGKVLHVPVKSDETQETYVVQIELKMKAKLPEILSERVRFGSTGQCEILTGRSRTYLELLQENLFHQIRKNQM